MLFILIPIVWLAVLALFVCICRVAADADLDPAGAVAPYGPIGERLVLSRFSRSPIAASRVRRPHARTAGHSSARAGASARRAATHGVR